MSDGSDIDAVRADVDAVILRLVDSLAHDGARAATLADLLLEDLGFSSLRLLELAFMIEDVFQLDPDEVGEAPPAGSVQELCDFVAGKVAAQVATVPSMDIVEATVANI
jgi:acyl carrier protein